MSIDELQEIGLERMDESAIRGFLDSQHVGVLGLPSEAGPYLLPLSYGFDGDSSCYFTYGLGAESRKEALSDAAETAGFLVYKADSAYMWESVLLTGSITRVPEDEWDEIDDVLRDTWHPELFAEVDLSRGVAVYELHVEDQSGIRHTGLPPGMEPIESVRSD